jgi:hypothetical protein
LTNGAACIYGVIQAPQAGGIRFLPLFLAEAAE